MQAELGFSERERLIEALEQIKEDSILERSALANEGRGGGPGLQRLSGIMGIEEAMDFAPD